MPELTVVDSNLLIHSARITDPKCVLADASVEELHRQGGIVCVVPQNIYEFWTVATRPVPAKGLGFSIAQAEAEVQRIRSRFLLFPDSRGLFDEWLNLVVAYKCKGKTSYDARIVAAMKTHNIDRILTFNGSDFARFPWLTILDPGTVAGIP